MKTRYKTLIFVGLAFFGFYAAIISYAQGPDDIFNVAMLLYFPSIVMQLIANEGNEKSVLMHAVHVLHGGTNTS